VVGVELVVVEGGRGVAVLRVVVVNIDVCGVWMAAMGMVNISGTTFPFVSTNVTNGLCAASQYINPCFSCLYFLGMSPYFVITTFDYN
jgi:hypothetical protein